MAFPGYVTELLGNVVSWEKLWALRLLSHIEPLLIVTDTRKLRGLKKETLVTFLLGHSAAIFWESPRRIPVIFPQF